MVARARSTSPPAQQPLDDPQSPVELSGLLAIHIVGAFDSARTQGVTNSGRHAVAASRCRGPPASDCTDSRLHRVQGGTGAEPDVQPTASGPGCDLQFFVRRHDQNPHPGCGGGDVRDVRGSRAASLLRLDLDAQRLESGAHPARTTGSFSAHAGGEHDRVQRAQLDQICPEVVPIEWT